MDDRLRTLERAFAAEPSDQIAAAALWRERGRVGQCPRCAMAIEYDKLGPSNVRLSESPLCWNCCIGGGLSKLAALTVEAANRRLTSKKPLPGAMTAVISRSAMARAARLSCQDGRVWPRTSASDQAIVMTISPSDVFAHEHGFRRRPGRALWSLALAHRGSDKLIALGAGLTDNPRGAARELGSVWKILEPVQERHGNAYVVAHGRPVWEKNLRERLRAWADRPATQHDVDVEPEEFLIRAPKMAWIRFFASDITRGLPEVHCSTRGCPQAAVGGSIEIATSEATQYCMVHAP